MDASGAGGVTAGGWYPDPAGRHEFRYWDGSGWTSDVSDQGQPSLDPLGPPPAPIDPVVVPPAPPVEPEPAPPAPPVEPDLVPPPPPVEPVFAPVAPPVAPMPVASTFSTTAPTARGSKKQLVLVAVVALLLALGAGAYLVISKSLPAKDAAAASITAARSAITAADLAVEPGSPELTESQRSKSALDEADSLFARGSLIDAGPYIEAKTKAEEAEATAQGITDKVEALDAQAAAATSEEAIDLYFTLAKTYPRTPQGQDAVANAATILVENLGSFDDDNLAAIKLFCEGAPGEVPETVYEAATTTLKSLAEASADEMASMVTSNKSWVKKIRGKGVNFTISRTNASDTRELTDALDALTVVRGSDFHDAVKLLRDCSKLGERCGYIARHPVRRSGRIEYFSSSQINKISSYSKQMAAKIKKARALLEDL